MNEKIHETLKVYMYIFFSAKKSDIQFVLIVLNYGNCTLQSSCSKIS